MVIGEVRKDLSLSEFGEFRKEVFDGDVFKYAIIRFEGEVVFINSDQWYQIFKDRRAVPGSIKIRWEMQRTYKKDANGVEELDEFGQKILVDKGREGWVLIGVKSIDQAKEEAQIEGEYEALVHEKRAIVMTSEVKVAKLEQELLGYSKLTPEMLAKLEAQFQMDDDDEDDDQETGAGADTGGENTPAPKADTTTEAV